jgi:hypothetical protein
MATPQPVANTSPTMLKQCRHGSLLFLREDMYIGRSLDMYGEFSELEAVLFAQIVRAGGRATSCLKSAPASQPDGSAKQTFTQALTKDDHAS